MVGFLTNKIALVTGGTRGIGLAIVQALKAQGHKVAVVGHSNNAPDCDLYINRDLSLSTDGVIRNVITALGGIDILVNNAGMQFIGSAIDYGRYDWQQSINLMLTAPFELSRQAAKHMMSRKFGRIVNISSVGGILGTRGIVGYSVAKAGLIELTKCLSNEWIPYGITVNSVAPGFIETDMQTLDGEHKTAMLGRIPAGRLGTAEEVAGAVCWLASEESRYVTGICVPVDGGWLAR